MIIKGVLLVLLTIHGLIHLMGVVRAVRLAFLPDMTRSISPGEGLLWLLCAVLFLSSAVLSGGARTWWPVGLAAVLLSQGLIIRHWSDARYGTVLNVLLSLACFFAMAQWRFDRGVERAVAALTSGEARTNRPAEVAPLATLPPPVQRWLKWAGLSDRPTPSKLHLRQRGRMRTEADGDWAPVYAEQWVSLQEPGFVWSARMYMLPGIPIAGRDTLLGGRGNMLIKAAFCFTLVDARGPEMDQGALVRFLAEIVWCPAAARAAYIHWTPIDDSHAMATLAQENTSVSATFEFSPDGEPVSIRADRYYTRDTGATLEKWRVTIDPSSFERVDGINVPLRSTVAWELAEGDFEWFQVEIHEVEFGGPSGAGDS